MAFFVDSGQAGAIVRNGTAILDFGDIPSPEASVAVTGLSGITPTSQVRISWQGDTMLNNNEADHLLAAASIKLTSGIPVQDTGFTVYADSNFALWTKRFRVRWTWWN